MAWFLCLLSVAAQKVGRLWAKPCIHVFARIGGCRFRIKSGMTGGKEILELVQDDGRRKEGDPSLRLRMTKERECKGKSLRVGSTFAYGYGGQAR